MKIEKGFKKEDLSAEVIAEVDEILVAVKKEYPNIEAVILFDCDWRIDRGRDKPKDYLDICIVSDDFVPTTYSMGGKRYIGNYYNDDEKLQEIVNSVKEARGKWFSVAYICLEPTTVEHYFEKYMVEPKVYSGFLYSGDEKYEPSKVLQARKIKK